MESVLDADREVDDCDADLDGDHGRDMSKRRDGDEPFSFSLSLKESLAESRNECVGGCTLGETAANADLSSKCN